MTSTSEQRRAYAGPPLFSFGFRPFFLGGALTAAFAPLVAALSLSGIGVPGAAYGAFGWHAHEMVFGYLGAVVSGFILTAVPNWTGRLPVLGGRLMALFALWLIGRLAVLFPGEIGPSAAAAADAPFLFAVAFVVWREVVSGRNWRNLPVCLLITLFAAANLVWHFEALRYGAGAFGFRMGIAVIALLLAVIGGRIVPSFTRNWFVRSGREAPDVAMNRLDRTALGATVLAAVFWTAVPSGALTGAVLSIAAALHFARMWRWRGWRTGAEPLVTILHIGYAWLVLGLALMGLSAIAPALLMPSAALHALTAGAAGVMPLAVMTRATLGHTGRELHADTATVLIYALVNLGAVLRVAAALVPAHYAAVVTGGAVLWGSAFLLFAVVYGRYLVTPRRAILPHPA